MQSADCRTQDGGERETTGNSHFTRAQGPNAVRRRPVLRTFGILQSAICILAAGCTVGPNFKPPKAEAPTPAGWDGTSVIAPAQTSHATTEAITISEWWNVFNDPQLTALVQQALKVNLDVRVAEAQLRQARAARGVAVAGFWPTVNATGAYQRSKPSGHLGGPGAPASDLWQAGLDAAWELDFFGGVRRNMSILRTRTFWPPSTTTPS